MTEKDISASKIRILGQRLRAATPEADQPELFPIVAVVEIPNVTNTADAWGKVVGANRKAYIVKDERGGPHARASEMFCSSLARLVGLQCPPSAIIQMTDGELFFGSEEIIGIADKVETSRILTGMTSGPSVGAIPGLSALLSAVYAFDCFIHNLDRHDENFLSIGLHGTRQFFLIDHARSMFSNWPFEDFLPAGCNTRMTGAKLRLRHGFEIDAARAMFDRLGGLAPEAIMGLMRRMPQDWLGESFSRDIEGWWGSRAFDTRLQRLREGLTNGSLL